MDNLPEQIVKRIEAEANKIYPLMRIWNHREKANIWIAGATAEATRSQVLLRALIEIRNETMQMEIQNRADNAISSYNNQTNR